MNTGVCETKPPLESRTRVNISFRYTKSGSGEQFLLLHCRATARTKGVSFSQTPVSYRIVGAPADGGPVSDVHSCSPV